MNFKIHLIIVVLLIGAVFTGWQYMLHRQQLSESAQSQPASDWFIRIYRANYGLNCNDASSATASSEYADSRNNLRPIREDNALKEISNLCNGRAACALMVTNELFALDPAPGCRDKTLEVEYRCFSYDKPRKVSAKYNARLAIDCREPVK